MKPNQTLALLLGAALGIAASAALIGLALATLGIVVGLQGGTASAVLQHPMFVAGSELVRTALLAGLPLAALWFLGRRA